MAYKKDKKTKQGTGGSQKRVAGKTRNRKAKKKGKG
jgi:hypothetical protein